MDREKIYSKAIQSETAKRYNIINRPNFEQCKNIENFYNNVVSKLEEMFFNKLIINSWFRNPELNSKVGGSKNSKHLQGLALDFKIEKDDIKKVFKNISDNGNIIFHKIILYENFIHIGYSNDPKKINARILLKKVEGGYEEII